VKYLSIELSEIAVRFVSVDDNKMSQHDFLFSDTKDNRYKDQLLDFLAQTGFDKQDFDECTICWSSFRSTCVPTNIFSETKPQTVFKLCFGEEIPAAHIDYNRIPEQGIVNVYEIPLWVKSFFVATYPRSIIQHEGSHFMRGIFSSPVFQLTITLVVHHNYFLLVIAKDNKLQFYSMFDYMVTDDIIYYMMFTLNQKNYLKEQATIQICQGVGASSGTVDEIKQKAEKLQDLKETKISINPDFITHSQKLCV